MSAEVPGISSRSPSLLSGPCPSNICVKWLQQDQDNVVHGVDSIGRWPWLPPANRGQRLLPLEWRGTSQDFTPQEKVEYLSLAVWFECVGLHMYTLVEVFVAVPIPRVFWPRKRRVKSNNPPWMPLFVESGSLVVVSRRPTSCRIARIK